MVETFEGNHVMTKNHEVEIGKEYCYYESMPTVICDVKVIDLHKNEESYGFKFEVTKLINGVPLEIGHTFEVSASNGNYAYGGMWRLYEKGEYR